MQKYIAFLAVLLAALALHPTKALGQATDGNIVGRSLTPPGRVSQMPRWSLRT